MKRIAIVSASIGAGHDGAATELGRRLRAVGFAVSRHDFLDVLPGSLGSIVRATYRYQLAVAPRSWDWLLAALGTRPVAWLVSWLSGLAGRPLLRAIGPDADLVVSTYPLASQALARLRRRGRLTVPVVTYLTDPSVHRLCVARSIDLHLAMHPITAAGARRLKADNVVVTAPAVAAEFRSPAGTAEQASCRRRFRLPADRPLALVLSGSWGVGEVEEAAWEVAASGVAIPVVACGQNVALRQRLRERGIGVPLGWVDDMPALMRACDVVVQNAGGLSSLEALATGLPVLTYRCLAGHGRMNAHVLEAAGLASWVRIPAALPDALAGALRTGQPPAARALLQAPDPADLIIDTSPASQPAADTSILGSPRLRWKRLAAASAALSCLLWLSTTGTSLAVEHGWRAAVPPAADHNAVFFVVGLAPGRPIDQQTVHSLLAANAAVAISSGLALRQPQDVRTLADAGLIVINAGRGSPYETGILRGRSAIPSAAHTITRLTGHVPRLMLSNGDLDVIDVGFVTAQRERVVVPRVVTSCAASPPRLPADGLVLVQVPPDAPCDLAATLDRLQRQANEQALVPTSLRELTR